MAELTPVTRKEIYLAAAGGQEITTPEPVTRLELFLAKLAGMDVEVPEPVTRVEYFLAAACGMEVEKPIPVTRLEMLLDNISGGKNDIPPVTRLEMFLAEIKGGEQPVLLTYTGNLPATITAVAHAIHSLTRYGKCEQRNLPLGYTQVDYIEGNGTTSFLDTGIVLNTIDLDVEVDFQYTDTASLSPRMAWGYMGSASNLPRWGFGVYAGKWLGSVNQTMAAGTLDTNRHTAMMRVFMDGETARYSGTIDGAELYATASFSSTSTFTANTLPVYLFARNNNGTAGNFAPVRTSRYKVKKAGIVANELVSCRRGTTPGFYDKVTGNFLTGTDLSAGPDSIPTPTPDNPVDIWTNNGALKVYRNLFDRNDPTTTINAYVGSSSVGSSAYIVSSTNDRSFIIKTKPNTKYTIRKLGGAEPYNRFRVANSSGFPQIGQQVTKLYEDTATTSGLRTVTVTTRNNGNYIIVYGLNGNPGTELPTFLDSFVVCEGDTINVGQIYADDTPEVLTVSGKNLFDPTKVLFGYYRDRPTGNQMQSQYNFMSSDDGYIPCLPNTDYTFVGTNKVNGTYSKYNSIYFFDSAKNYLGASSYQISQPTTGTTPSNCYYLQIRSNPLDTSSVTVQEAFSRFNWQLELGSTATAYEPYVAPQTVSVPMLLSVGDYKDAAELISGIKTGKVGVYVFTGKEAFTKGSAFYTTDTRFLPSKAGGITPICTHFRGISSAASRVADSLTMTVNGPGSSYVGCVYFYADRSLYATAADFKAWLAAQYAAGTPVIVLYPLATETTEQTTAQHLVTHNGVNVVDSTANVSPVEARIEYYGTETPMLGMMMPAPSAPEEPAEEPQEEPAEEPEQNEPVEESEER